MILNFVPSVLWITLWEKQSTAAALQRGYLFRRGIEHK